MVGLCNLPVPFLTPTTQVRLVLIQSNGTFPTFGRPFPLPLALRFDGESSIGSPYLARVNSSTVCAFKRSRQMRPFLFSRALRNRTAAMARATIFIHFTARMDYLLPAHFPPTLSSSFRWPASMGGNTECHPVDQILRSVLILDREANCSLPSLTRLIAAPGPPRYQSGRLLESFVRELPQSKHFRGNNVAVRERPYHPGKSSTRP